nr:unnamed protein product [Spirometra erinaceieuropaei]
MGSREDGLLGRRLPVRLAAGYPARPQVADSGTTFNEVNDRLAYVRLKGHFTSISIVAVHAPTSAAEQRDKEAFYSQLQALVERLPRRDLLIVAGDWNGRTVSGDPTTSHLLDRFGLGSRCKNVSGKPSTLSDSVRDVNGGFIADNSPKVKRWREHFDHHLNFDAQTSSPLLSSSAKFLPSPTYALPCDPPSEEEVADDIRKLRNNKAPGEDDIPVEIFKSCVDTLAPWLHEIRVYHASIRSVLLSVCECWALRVEDERKLEVFDHYCLRIILRVKLTDFVSNETVRTRCDNIARITQAIQERRLRWFGHVLRRPPQELSVTALDPAPLPHWRRRRGGQFKTWLDTIRQDMDMVLGPSVFGLRRWRREWVELSRSAAAAHHAWRGTVRDIIEAG